MLFVSTSLCGSWLVARGSLYIKILYLFDKAKGTKTHLLPYQKKDYRLIHKGIYNLYKNEKSFHNSYYY